MSNLQRKLENVGSMWALPKSNSVAYLKRDHQDYDKVCRTKGCKEIPSPYHNYNMGGEVIPWGMYNDLPHRLQKMVMSDKDAPHLLRTNFNFLVGKDICAYREEFSGGEKREKLIDYPPLKAWKKKMGFDWLPYITGRGKGFVLTLNAFTEFVLTKGSNYPSTFGECYSVRNIDPCFIRIGRPNVKTGKIEFYMVYSEEHPAGKRVPAFDPKNPRKYKKFIYHTKDEIVGSRFYAYPDFVGVEDHIKIRKLFNCYNIAGFDNGWSVKNQVEISLKMLMELLDKMNSELTDKQKPFTFEDVWEGMITAIDNKLAGVENNQKNVFTKFTYDDEGNWQGVKITPIKQEIAIKEYLELAKFTQQNNAASFGVANAIAGTETQGKLGNSSEMRNHINFHVTYKAHQMRLWFLRDLEIISMVNGWDEDVKFKIYDHPQPVTLDVSKTGLEKEKTAA